HNLLAPEERHISIICSSGAEILKEIHSHSSRYGLLNADTYGVDRLFLCKKIICCASIPACT
ncbi:MAG: hypothetical protein PHY08_05735, partial [Candidatus Cloacimonetes bacterium]|nr:hypothetical protein [Candidatus Cloacimonadota bacterium]